MSMILQEHYKLNNGIKIPKVGLGTWFIDNDSVIQAVKDAVQQGYRHIDTAQAYGNEEGVGRGIKACGLDRTELFITTKLAAEIKSYDEAVSAIDTSLETMGLDYIDSMIIHSPKPWQEYQGDDRFFEGNLLAWKALEKAYEAGKLRAIGLSNFEIEDVRNIIDNGSVKPMVNQVLAHITNVPDELIEYCGKQDILVEAYSPIGHGELFKNDEVAKMAEKYNVSVPQLGIRFDLQLGLLPLPKTANPEHMENNADLDFTISKGDMETLQHLDPIEDYGEASKFPVYSGK